MTVLTAPTPISFSDLMNHERSIFVAGGISGCADWQSDLIAEMDDERYAIINPRRSEGLEKTGPEAEQQIKWEQAALHAVDTVLFWFPKQSVCPITLYELGQCLARCRHESLEIIIGVHPEYERKFDVQVQSNIAANRKHRCASVTYLEGWKPFKNQIWSQFGR